MGLSIVGLYAANWRTCEIGIRMAIGATAPKVLRMLLRQGVALALSGLLLGLEASVGAGGLSRGVSNRRRSRDFVSLSLVAPVVFVVGAGDIPGRLAARVSPVEAAPRRVGRATFSVCAGKASNPDNYCVNDIHAKNS